jgi:peptidoglycan hydrolase-like protein with peptidoglycan-binding domain
MSKMKFFVGVAVFAFAFLGASVANAAYMHSMTLKMGMTNTQVKSLQQTLNMTSCKVSVIGVGSAGYETMYFGAKTKAAVQCYQMANGLVADGIVGPMTGSKLAGVSGNVVVTPVCPPGFTCTPAGGSTGTPTTGSGLSGTVGSLEYSLVSAYSSEDVGEGDDNVKVAGLELDADDSDSDVRVTAVKLNFDVGTADGDLEDYIEEVTVWFGSTKVATVDADEFNDDNDFERVTQKTLLLLFQQFQILTLVM